MLRTSARRVSSSRPFRTRKAGGGTRFFVRCSISARNRCMPPPRLTGAGAAGSLAVVVCARACPTGLLGRAGLQSDGESIKVRGSENSSSSRMMPSLVPVEKRRTRFAGWSSMPSSSTRWFRGGRAAGVCCSMVSSSATGFCPGVSDFLLSPACCRRRRE